MQPSRLTACPHPPPPTPHPRAQAAEVGLTAAALARHLLNAASLSAAASGALPATAEPLLLPAPPPPVEPLQSFAWSHMTGANRPLQEVQAELEEFEVGGAGGGGCRGRSSVSQGL
jgi:hypothetical protein